METFKISKAVFMECLKKCKFVNSNIKIEYGDPCIDPPPRQRHSL